METLIDRWLAAWWTQLDEAGAWLIFGFLAAGAVHALLPAAMLARAVGGRGLRSIALASVIGAPLPLCSCSIIPVAASLRKRGASRGSVTALAVATPEVDVPSVALTWGLMGPAVAIARPIAALATAIAAGLAVERATDRREPATRFLPIAGPTGPGGESDCTRPCCSTAGASQATTGAPKRGLGRRLMAAAQHGLIEVPRDLAPWLLAGLALSALVSAIVPDGWIAGTIGTGLGAMLMALVVSMPLYVCATAATPLAASLIAAGLSPGAALVMLLAGPATNTTTMAWVLKDMGWRGLGAYLGSVATLSVLAGLAFDAAVPTEWVRSTVASTVREGSGVTPIALILLTMLVVAMADRAVGWWRRRSEPTKAAPEA